MGKEENKVAEFRDIVNTTLASQIDEAVRHDQLWRKGQKVFRNNGGYTFASVNRDDDRPAIMGRVQPEDTWAIIFHGMKLGAYSGAVAIISTEDQPKSLLRRWEFSTTPGIYELQSDKVVASLREISKTVKWAGSPFMYSSYLGELAIVTPQEETQLQLSMTQREKEYLASLAIADGVNPDTVSNVVYLRPRIS